MTQIVNIGIKELFLIGQLKNAVTIGGTKELTLTV